MTSEPTGVYTSGGTYEVFAGRACTRGVALPSLQLSDVSDDVSDFSEDQLFQVTEWSEFFRNKYPKVSTLVRDTPEQRVARQARYADVAAAAAQAKTDAALAAAEDTSGRVVSLDELRAHDGSAQGGGTIWIALGGHIFDVSGSDYLYGPGKPRGMYAGRSITRALAQSSTAAEELDRGDDLTGLTKEHLTTLRKRVAFFLGKFEKVGLLGGADVLRP